MITLHTSIFKLNYLIDDEIQATLLLKNFTRTYTVRNINSAYEARDCCTNV